MDLEDSLPGVQKATPSASPGPEEAEIPTAGRWEAGTLGQGCRPPTLPDWCKKASIRTQLSCWLPALSERPIEDQVREDPYSIPGLSCCDLGPLSLGSGCCLVLPSLEVLLRSSLGSWMCLEGGGLVFP